MLLKSCGRCGKLIPYGVPRCPECEGNRDQEQQDNEQAAQRRYNQKRDRGGKDFYKSKGWRDLSTSYMQQHGWRCEECGELATDCHHVIAINAPDGQAHALDYQNLKALCVSCHNKVHGRFKPAKSQR